VRTYFEDTSIDGAPADGAPAADPVAS